MSNLPFLTSCPQLAVTGGLVGAFVFCPLTCTVSIKPLERRLPRNTHGCSGGHDCLRTLTMPKLVPSRAVWFILGARWEILINYLTTIAQNNGSARLLSMDTSGSVGERWRPPFNRGLCAASGRRASTPRLPRPPGQHRSGCRWWRRVSLLLEIGSF